MLVDEFNCDSKSNTYCGYRVKGRFLNIVLCYLQMGLAGQQFSFHSGGYATIVEFFHCHIIKLCRDCIPSLIPS